MCDLREAKICDLCTTCIVHENIVLEGVNKMGKRVGTTYSFKVPMDYTAGVQIAEAIGDIGQLIEKVRVGYMRQDRHKQLRVGPRWGS